MTRTFSFSLTQNLQNLWSLISATFTDPYFGNQPYVPSFVKELKIENDASNSGAPIFTITGPAATVGPTLATGGTFDVGPYDLNTVDLHDFNIKSNTAGSTCNIYITA